MKTLLVSSRWCVRLRGGDVSPPLAPWRLPARAGTRPFRAVRPRVLAGLCALVFALGAPTVPANPPAPYYLLYGQVRDKYGTPLTTSAATILLQTPAGATVAAAVMPGYAPGVNYYLKVPMDSAQSPAPYQPAAQVGGAPFKLWVVINNATNLPIEMTGNFAAAGQPGTQARLDLTLGVDANGDGIPDSWEQAFLAAIGSNRSLSSLTPNSVLTSDGLTVRQQYLYGTYPFNPSRPCAITMLGFHGTLPRLRFPTVTGRSYTVLSSTDNQHWSTAAFYLPTDDPAGPSRNYYYSPGVAAVEVYVTPISAPETARFYRLLVQ